MYRLLFLFIFLAGCTNKEKQWSPQEEYTMARIMMDVHMAQAALKMAPIDKRDSIENVYWTQIATIHEMQVEDIKEEIDILKSNPAQLEKILKKAESLVDSLKSGPRSPVNLNN